MTQEQTDLATPRPEQPLEPAKPALDMPSPPNRLPRLFNQPRRLTGKKEKKYFRLSRIFGLQMSTTFVDIVRGIEHTAPVGRVLSIQFEKNTSVMRGTEYKAATVLFDDEAAPVDLLQLAKQGTFLVCGACPFVAIHYGRAFHGNDHHELSSRVLVIRGRSDVAEFTEGGIRDLVANSPAAVRALGPLGLESEPVVIRDWEGTRHMEWRFFDNEKQTRVLFLVLRRHFYKKLTIFPGRDPCWNPYLYPKDRKDSMRSRATTSSRGLAHSENKSAPPRPPQQQGAPDRDLHSSQFERHLSELLGRSRAAKEAAEKSVEKSANAVDIQEQERRFDEVFQKKVNDEAPKPEERMQQEPEDAQTPLLSPEEEKKMRLAKWSQGLQKMSRGRPG